MEIVRKGLKHATLLLRLRGCVCGFLSRLIFNIFEASCSTLVTWVCKKSSVDQSELQKKGV